MSPRNHEDGTEDCFSTRPKPYSRNTGKRSTKSPVLTLEEIQALMASPPDARSQRGFPTYAQYKGAEAAYLNSLSVRKRDKALITQDNFDKIWDLLHDPIAPIGTSQYRYWVRKMFTLSTRDEDELDDGKVVGQQVQPVVLHKGRPVAIVEQLYELLCHCHGAANHSGRDRTTAVVRQHYSWVPKDLIAHFVKICPTCMISRNKAPAGSNVSDLPSDQSQATPVDPRSVKTVVPVEQGMTSFRPSRSTLSISDLINAENLMDDDGSTPQLARPRTNGPHDATGTSRDKKDTIYALSVRSPEHQKAAHLNFHSPYVRGMVRDVSLLNGVHSWDHLDNPEDSIEELRAHPEMLANDPFTSLLSSRRPQIPGVMMETMWPGLNVTTRIESVKLGKVNSPPSAKAWANGIAGSTGYRSYQPALVESLPDGTQRLWSSKGPLQTCQETTGSLMYSSQIDPALLKEDKCSGENIHRFTKEVQDKSITLDDYGRPARYLGFHTNIVSDSSLKTLPLTSSALLQSGVNPYSALSPFSLDLTRGLRCDINLARPICNASEEEASPALSSPEIPTPTAANTGFTELSPFLMTPVRAGGSPSFASRWPSVLQSQTINLDKAADRLAESASTLSLEEGGIYECSWFGTVAG